MRVRRQLPVGQGFVVLFDSDRQTGRPFWNHRVPTTYFVRPDGTVEGRYIGETNAGILESHVDAIDN